MIASFPDTSSGYGAAVAQKLVRTFTVMIICITSVAGSLVPSVSAAASAVTSPATSVTHRGAVLNGSVNHTTGSFTSVFAIGTKVDLSDPVFDYTGVYSSEKTLYIRGGHGGGSVGTTNISFSLNEWTPTGPGSELLPDTTYYFRAGIQDGPDDPNCLWTENCYVWGSILSFKTRAAVGPEARTGEASAIGADTASITGLVIANDGLANVVVEYSTKSNLGDAVSTSAMTAGAGTSEKALAFLLSGLLAETTYFYRLVATNQYGISRGEIQSFVTTPPIGVSISSGANYTITKSVSLEVSWPVGATSMTISNDGGFRSSSAKTFALSRSVQWELDDSVEGLYTKIVYVRFGGPGIDVARTFTDDIILDNRAPVVTQSKGEITGSFLILSVSAKDEESGLQSIEIRNSSKVVETEFSKNILIKSSELGLKRSTSKSSVGKANVLGVQFRVSDKAGNKTSWISVGSASPASSAKPVLSRAKKITDLQIATYFKMRNSAKTKIAIKVSSSSKRICNVKSGRVRAMTKGQCRLIINGRNFDGKKITKTLILNVKK